MISWLMPSSFHNLMVRNAELANQWHPTKNGILTPSDVTPGSGKKVWWVCERRHEWPAKVSHRTHGSGCPYCSGRLASADNNLAINNPELASQWLPTKNGELTPSDVTPGSGKKVWWLCKRGHGWRAFVYNRTARRSTGCPMCHQAKSHGKS